MMNNSLDFTILSPYNHIFTSNEAALNYAIQKNIICHSSICNICLNSMNIQKYSNIQDEFIFRCSQKTCRAKKGIKKGGIFEKINVPLHKIFRICYCIVLNYNLYQSINFCEISENTFLKIKDIITERIPLESSEKIGGPTYAVQMDETAICNGQLIINPSSTLDENDKIQWLVGGIDNANPKRFFIEIVENRKIETMTNIMKSKIIQGTVIISDGYPSYPTAVKNFGSIHHVVQHKNEFVNKDGKHTNDIENLWSHLKQEYRKRGGVNKERFITFLKEFCWRKRNIKNKDQKDLLNGFNLLVSYLNKYRII